MLFNQSDPAKTHLGVNGQNHLGQLHFSNAVIWRVECLAGAAHHQLCWVWPSGRSSATVARHRSRICRIDAGGVCSACFNFELSERGRNQGANGPFMQDHQLIPLQPLAGPHEQLVAIGAAGHFTPQFTHQGAALVLAHPPKAKNRAGYLLVIE